MSLKHRLSELEASIDPAALRAAAVHPTRTAWAPGDYELFDNHILPQGVTLIIDGVIKHNPVGDFTWSESNRRSPYSLFLVTVSDVAIKGSGRIENKYEAVSVDAGGGNFKFEGVTISKEGANKQVISSQADSLIKISRIWADFFPANTSNQPI